MNTDVVIQLLVLVVSLFKNNDQVSVAGILVQIAGKVLRTYEDQTGKPMDISLIKAEAPV